MLEKLLEYLEDKKILILGVGIEGKSTYDFLRRNFPEKSLFIADKSTDLLEKYPEFMEDMDLELSMGEQYLNGIEEFDLIIKTPGISFKGIDIFGFADKITNQLQLLLEFVDCFSIGITGTKGKSTTSTLIYEVLQNQGKDAVLVGNGGNPIFDDIEKITEKTITVLELSSHGLQYVTKSPNIAIWLNIYEEHLDYYKSFEEYADAKFNIAKYQKDEDFLIYNYDNDIMQKYNYKENDYAISMENVPTTKNAVIIKEELICCNNKNMMSTNHKLKLKGMHNINNIMFVFAVCDILKLSIENAIETIEKFDGLEHRMEFVGKINGVEYYNDSIATIPEAAINSIKALEKVNTVIVGGKDRGVSMEGLVDFLKSSCVENVICLPKTGEYIFNELQNMSNKNVFMTQNLEEAVMIAKKETKKDTICVLAPAASSYGFFKNFKERGNIFKKLVLENNELT